MGLSCEDGPSVKRVVADYWLIIVELGTDFVFIYNRSKSVWNRCERLSLHLKELSTTFRV